MNNIPIDSSHLSTLSNPPLPSSSEKKSSPVDSSVQRVAQNVLDLTPCMESSGHYQNFGHFPYEKPAVEGTSANLDEEHEKTLEEFKEDSFQEKAIRKKEHLGEFLEQREINAQPWSGKELHTKGLVQFKSHSDPDLLEFLIWIKQNPNASNEEVQNQLNHLKQNCSTNTFLGLSKIGALTEEGQSPRSELRKEYENKGNINFATILGIDEVDRSLNSEPETVIPKGTVVFVINPTQQKRNPFNHVFFAEQTGKNNEPIYRSLNEGQDKSNRQSLDDILKGGKYNHMNSQLLFTKKYATKD